MTRALFALVFLSCGGITTPPDEQYGRVEVYWHAHQRLDGVEVVADVVREHGEALCGAKKFDNLWSAIVHWRDSHFWCEGVHPEPDMEPPYLGCQPYRGLNVVEVGWQPSLLDSALSDELLHIAWEICTGRSGEVSTPRGAFYDADFAAELARVNADVRARLGAN